MSRPRSATHKPTPVFLPPTRMDWNDEKLDALDAGQLKSLLENLGAQREYGRISQETADDLTRRITARLPASALTPRRKRPRAIALLDAQVAASLGGLAAQLKRRYDLSESTARQASAGTAGFRALSLTDKQGNPRTGAAMKDGGMAIDRFIAYRVRDSLASLAFHLNPDQPQQTGRFVVIATDDLLQSGVPLTEMTPASRELGWSQGSRERLRALAAVDFAEAQRLYVDLIARVATKREQELAEEAEA
jgi:hypothetical protein